MPRRAKTITDIRSEARKHTATCLKVLAGIVASPTASETARITAANSLLDRAYGKAAQPVTGEDGEGPLTIEIVERIVDAARDHVESEHREGLHTTH